ncbi:MAG: SRPBCC domain-containing protein [Pseudonocardia sp.]
MTTTANRLGRVLADADGGARLEFRREHAVPVQDLWAAITEPERLARWIGTWTGDPAPGKTVQFQMLAEAEECQPEPLLIVECEPPHRLAVQWPAPDGHGEPWRVEASVTATATGSCLLFAQHFAARDGVRDAGPGWQWYLDRLAAALVGSPMPAAWDDYYTDELRGVYR